jgi:long-chain acyl-CoA synthetase
VICDLVDKVRLILDCVSGKEHTLKTIVIMEAFDKELVVRGQQSGIEILSLKDVEVSSKMS